MLAHLLLIAAIGLAGSGGVGQAVAQPAEGVGRDEGQDREVRRSEGNREEADREEAEARRARRRERWERFRNATPEERRRMRNERMVNMAARAYELDEAQKELVRGEIEAMREERRAAMGAEAEEYDTLREQMFEFWRQRREQADGEGDGDRGSRWRRLRNDPGFRALRERMREIERKHPFDWEASLKRVEALLPEEQARKGRARLEERFQRMRERRRRWQERRARREERRARREREERSARADRTPAAPDRDTELQAVLAEAQKKLADPSLSSEERAALLRRIEEAARGVEPAKPVPLHPWEKFTREFIAVHDLAPAQQASALAILKELRSRAAQIERVNAARIAEAKALKDKAKREQRLRELRKPIDRLFEELKTRLEGLLTAGQREKAGKTPL